MTYKEVYNYILEKTDNFNSDYGTIVVNNRQELGLAIDILSNAYQLVKKVGLDYDHRDDDGLKYKIEYEMPLKGVLGLNDTEEDEDLQMNENIEYVIEPTRRTKGITKDEVKRYAKYFDIDYNTALRRLKMITAPETDYDRVLDTMEPVDEDIEKHDTLNPDLWDENNELRPEVRDKLEDIVKHFDDALKSDGIELDVVDVCIIGSNASYNYNDASDIDLHIIADTSVYDDEDLALKAYQAYKSLFNNKYDPTIRNHEVEIYVEPHQVHANSKGIYSLNDGWLKVPENTEIPEISQEEVEDYLAPFKERFEEVIEDGDLEDIDKLIDDIYYERQSSIIKGGEFAIPNLAFKEFRAQGYLQRLRDRKVELENKAMSLHDDDKMNDSIKDIFIDLDDNTDINEAISEFSAGQEFIGPDGSKIRITGLDDEVHYTMDMVGQRKYTAKDPISAFWAMINEFGYRPLTEELEEIGNGVEFRFPSIKDTLEVYLEWEGIIGYADDIFDMFEERNYYDEVEEYLEEEGIYGYTNNVVNILRGEPAYCRDMELEDFYDVCRGLYIDPKQAEMFDGETVTEESLKEDTHRVVQSTDKDDVKKDTEKKIDLIFDRDTGSREVQWGINKVAFFTDNFDDAVRWNRQLDAAIAGDFDEYGNPSEDPSYFDPEEYPSYIQKISPDKSKPDRVYAFWRDADIRNIDNLYRPFIVGESLNEDSIKVKPDQAKEILDDLGFAGAVEYDGGETITADSKTIQQIKDEYDLDIKEDLANDIPANSDTEKLINIDFFVDAGFKRREDVERHFPNIKFTAPGGGKEVTLLAKGSKEDIAAMLDELNIDPEFTNSVDIDRKSHGFSEAYNRLMRKFDNIEDARKFARFLDQDLDPRIDQFDRENEDGSVDNWYEVYYWDPTDYHEDELEEAVNKYDGYKLVSSENINGKIIYIYRKVIKDENGEYRGLWAACPQNSKYEPDESKLFDITYRQATGRDPINIKEDTVHDLYVVYSDDYFEDGERSYVADLGDGMTSNGAIDKADAKVFNSKKEAQDWIDAMNSEYDDNPGLERFTYGIEKLNDELDEGKDAKKVTSLERPAKRAILDVIDDLDGKKLPEEVYKLVCDKLKEDGKVVSLRNLEKYKDEAIKYIKTKLNSNLDESLDLTRLKTLEFDKPEKLEFDTIWIENEPKEDGAFELTAYNKLTNEVLIFKGVGKKDFNDRRLRLKKIIETGFGDDINPELYKPFGHDSYDSGYIKDEWPY